MPHEFESGFFARKPAWHGLGTVVEEALTAQQALEAADLEWRVDLFPVFTVAAHGETSEVTIPIEDKFAVVRDSDLSVLGVVGGRYTPVQNNESFSFFDSLVDSGDAKYEAAGALRGGQLVWLTAKMDREIRIAGTDRTDLYLLLANAHDGTMSFTAAVTPVRVVCMNTLNVALKGAKQSWKMRHTESITGRISEARRTLGLTFEYADVYEKTMNRLVEEEYTKREFEDLIRKTFPAPKENAEGRFSEEQYALLGVLESSPTIDDAIRFTRYGALNAVREYEDWLRNIRGSKRKTEAEQRTEAVWFGRNVTNSNRVLQELLTV